MKITIKNSTVSFAQNDFTPFSIDASAFTAGICLKRTGVTTSSSGFSCTDYIKMAGATKITASAQWGSSINGGICYYTEDKTFISCVDVVSGASTTSNISNTVTDIPSNAVYVRIGGSTTKGTALSATFE